MNDCPRQNPAYRLTKMSTFFQNLKKDDKFINEFWSWFDSLPIEEKKYYWKNEDPTAAEQKFLYSYHMKKIKSEV